MGRCVIFCAGGFDQPVIPIEKSDLIIAADGGLAHVRTLGLQPDVILGDFDSLGYVPERANVFPVEKDDTDAMLAVRKGLELGCREFLLYGCLDGPRLDHTIANLQLLQFLADRGAFGILAGLNHMAAAVKDASLTFPGRPTGIFSVFCMGADARGVTIRGAKYDLSDGTLSAGFPLGVSNHFLEQEASVTVTQGSLLCLWERKNGLPVYKGGFLYGYPK